MNKFCKFVTIDGSIARRMHPFTWRYITFTFGIPVKETRVYIGYIPIFEDVT